MGAFRPVGGGSRRGDCANCTGRSMALVTLGQLRAGDRQGAARTASRTRAACTEFTRASTRWDIVCSARKGVGWRRFSPAVRMRSCHIGRPHPLGIARASEVGRSMSRRRIGGVGFRTGSTRIGTGRCRGDRTERAWHSLYDRGADPVGSSPASCRLGAAERRSRRPRSCGSSTTPRCAQLIRRSRGRRGVARLRLVLDEIHPETKRTRSEMERLFLRMCARAGLATTGGQCVAERRAVDVQAGLPLARRWSDRRSRQSPLPRHRLRVPA